MGEDRRDAIGSPADPVGEDAGVWAAVARARAGLDADPSPGGASARLESAGGEQGVGLGSGGALRLLVTGGGTGGHTYPALTSIRALQARLATAGRRLEVLWVGVGHGLEARVAGAERIAFRAVTTGKLRRSPNRQELAENLADLFRIPVGIAQAIWAVARFRPDAVLCTGGYVAVPVGVAAWLLRRRLLVHEQTQGVGLANRILSRLATRILLSHESSLTDLPQRARRRAVVTGNPVRPQILAGDPARGRAVFGLDDAVPVVLVTGGAQGAMQINRLLLDVLADLLPSCQVVHQCGTHGLEEIRDATGGLAAELAGRYHLRAYLGEELPDVLAAADVVVARSGAGTVAELTALGKATVLIPMIPADRDEQRRTARHLAEHGAAIMLAAHDATSGRLRDTLLGLLHDPARRAQLADAARAHGRPDAAERVVDEVLALATDPRNTDAITR